MKKIAVLFSALAVTLFALTGCVDSNTDAVEAPVDISEFYLRGGMNDWGVSHKLQAKSGKYDSYTVTFTANSSESEFAIANSDWSPKFCDGARFSVSEETSLASGGDNAKISGLTSGKEYTMTVTPGYGKVNVIVNEK